jgi:hypothetical protein
MTIQPVTPLLVGSQVYTYTAAAMANGDTTAVLEITDFADKTVTFVGTFGAGGSVTLEGSNDNANWFALKDPSSSAITKTAAGISAVLEHPRYIRGHVTAGDGTTALVMILMARRGFR